MVDDGVEGVVDLLAADGEFWGELDAVAEDGADGGFNVVGDDVVAALEEGVGFGGADEGDGAAGAISLIRTAKAYALLQGRNYVIPDDIKSAVRPVLRHRVQLAPELAISGQHIDHTLDAIVNQTDAPRT